MTDRAKAGRVLMGDCRDILPTLPENSVQCCVTSPPYWGLRDYGVDSQIGLEPTLEDYIATMVTVFDEVRRALKDDGTLWLNLGDSYAASGRGGGGGSLQHHDVGRKASKANSRRKPAHGFKPKDLVGVPWRIAFALQAAGWCLRSDIIWHKPNPIPESVRDRPTSAHEHIFLLTKSARYYYDADAIKQPLSESSIQRMAQPTFDQQTGGPKDGINPNRSCRRALENLKDRQPDGANCRNVWTIATRPYSEAHFATFPPEIPERCIAAGSRPGDTILDPFFGSGTVGEVAQRMGRQWIGIELNDEYQALIEKRTAQGGLPLRVA